jgi:hypothetical protein
MAEALAVVGVVTNIVQLVEFGTKVLGRINDFHNKLDNVPEALRHIKAQLPLLLYSLKATQHSIGTGVVNTETEEALLPVINECRAQIETLDKLVDRLLPDTGDSRWKKSKKALLSLHEDASINRITSALQGLVATLTLYHTAEPARSM